jgi:hypothetical protein
LAQCDKPEILKCGSFAMVNGKKNGYFWEIIEILKKKKISRR